MRVGRAFAFVDLSGFTSFTATHGDDEAGHVLMEFRRVIREVSSRRGVRVAKWQGDGAMFVSVDPAPLTEAVLEIERRIDQESSPLRLRAGITWGNVILFEGDDYIGSAVNLAARLCDHAAPNEILASVELLPHVPVWAKAVPAGPIVIRGFVEPVPVIRLERLECADGAGGVTDPICGMRIPSSGVGAARGDVGFCSESCALAWDDSQRAVTPGSTQNSFPAG